MWKNVVWYLIYLFNKIEVEWMLDKCYDVKINLCGGCLNGFNIV